MSMFANLLRAKMRTWPIPRAKARKLFEAKTIVRLPIENRNKKPKTEKKETKNGKAKKKTQNPKQ